MQEQASQSSPQEQTDNQERSDGPDNGGEDFSGSLKDNVEKIQREQREAKGSDVQAQRGNDGAGRTEGDDRQTEKRAPPRPKASEFASLHKGRVELAAQKQELAAQKQELEKARKFIENAKRSPADAVKAMGYESMKEFLEKVAESGGEMTPEQQKIWDLEERLAAREKQEEEQKRAYQEQQESAKYQQEVAQWHQGIREYVTQPDSPWNSTLVSLEGQEGQVLAVIQEQHAEYGDQMDLNEALEVALDRVNKNLERQMRQGLSQIAANPRGQAILNEIVGTVKSPQRSQSSRAKTSGLTSQARNETIERHPDKDLSLDDMLARNTEILKREQARF